MLEKEKLILDEDELLYFYENKKKKTFPYFGIIKIF
jgi:hypothetical protein